MGLKFQQSTCAFDPLFSLFGALLIYIINQLCLIIFHVIYILSNLPNIGTWIEGAGEREILTYIDRIP